MPLPPEALNIAPEGATVPPPDPSPEGANSSPEGAKTRNPIWKRDKDNSLKRLNLNRELYDLTCGCHHKPPMAKKLSQKRKALEVQAIPMPVEGRKYDDSQINVYG